MSMAKHAVGAIWLIEQSFIEYAFSSFTSSSYYVKKTGAQFFSQSFLLWSTPVFSETIPKSDICSLKEACYELISKLITGVQPCKDSQSESISNCCILTLKQLVENGVDFKSEHYKLIQALTNYYEKMNRKEKYNQDAVDLLVAIAYSDHSQSYDITTIVQLLIKKQMFTTVFYLISAFLGSSKRHQPVSSKSLLLFLMPFYVTCEEKLLNEEENIFDMKQEEINQYLQNEMSNRSDGFLIISASLVSLTKLTSVMNTEAIKSLLHSLSLTFLPSPEESNNFPHTFLENGRICLALLELFSSFCPSENYTRMDYCCKIKLFELLIVFLKKPFANSNIVSEALCILKSVVANNACHKIVLNTAMAHELIELLCRKLLDCKEPIVDNALHLSEEIMVGKDYDFWKEIVLSHSVHLIVWDLAIEGHHEGVIKASALKVITNACFKSHYFMEIKSAKGIDEVNFMKILCDYVQDPDFFVQRESVLCACKWMKVNEKLLSNNCKTDLFNILLLAVQSLDLDLKLIALDQYRDLMENDAFFPALSQTNINLCFESYATTHFITAVMYAMDDSEESVKYKAAKILFDLRNKLTQLGINKDYFDVRKLETTETPKPEILENAFISSVSAEERDKGIDDVMMISTTQQLLNICKTKDSSITNPMICTSYKEQKDMNFSPVLPFWQYLWNGSFIDVLSTEEVNQSIHSDYSVSVLEDILAAEKTEFIYPINDTPDCY